VRKRAKRSSKQGKSGKSRAPRGGCGKGGVNPEENAAFKTYISNRKTQREEKSGKEKRAGQKKAGRSGGGDPKRPVALLLEGTKRSELGEDFGGKLKTRSTYHRGDKFKVGQASFIIEEKGF